MNLFVIGNKVYHKGLHKKGKIIDIKWVGSSRAYLVKFPMFAFSWNPFRRLLWTWGMELERIK